MSRGPPKPKGPTTAGEENPGLRGLSSVAGPVSHRTPRSGQQTYSGQHLAAFGSDADLLLFNTLHAGTGRDIRWFGTEGFILSG